MSYTTTLGRYLSTMELEVKYIIKYRIELLVNLVRTLISPLAIIILWSVVGAATGTGIAGLSGSLLYSYFIIASVVGATVLAAGIAYGVQNDVKSGNIAALMIKPVSYPWLTLADNFSETIMDMLVTFVPLVILVIVLFAPPLSLVTFTEFMIELMGIFFMTSALFFIIGCLSFYFANINGMVNVVLWMFSVLGGRMIPLTVFPQNISSIIQVTPMYLVYYLPAGTFTNTISQQFIFNGMLSLLEWTVVFGVIAVVMWKTSKSKLMAAGG